MRIIWPCSTVRGRAQDGKSADGVVTPAAMVVAWIVGALALSTSCPGGPDDRAGSPAYWMLKGFRAVTLEGGGLDPTIVRAAVTPAFAGAFPLPSIPLRRRQPKPVRRPAPHSVSCSARSIQASSTGRQRRP
jgi:hypothetical protein